MIVNVKYMISLKLQDKNTITIPKSWSEIKSLPKEISGSGFKIMLKKAIGDNIIVVDAESTNNNCCSTITLSFSLPSKIGFGEYEIFIYNAPDLYVIKDVLEIWK